MQDEARTVVDIATGEVEDRENAPRLLHGEISLRLELAAGVLHLRVVGIPGGDAEHGERQNERQHRHQFRQDQAR